MKMNCLLTPPLVPTVQPSFVAIRSNTMSHITFKMCQFVLIVHLRDYHYDVMVLLWCSLTYFYYISKLLSDWSLFRTTSHVPRHQSHLDCIIRIYISDYPGIFSHFPHVLDSITIRFTMFRATQKIKNQRRKKECSEYFFNIKTYVEDLALYLSD